MWQAHAQGNSWLRGGMVVVGLQFCERGLFFTISLKSIVYQIILAIDS